MKVFYNEIEPYAALWLRNLSKDGRIPPGLVDERSIADVKGSDLAGTGQAHFFAGIGGWPLALRLAGWPEDRPVWTGSCPCQPFSVAGKGQGEKDERHLWPEFRRLISECLPPIVFGEQVAGAAGRSWLSGVRADLEELGYAVGAADLCAASVGAPHIRQRLYWVADSAGIGRANQSQGADSGRSLVGTVDGADSGTRLRTDPKGIGGRGTDGRSGTVDRLGDTVDQGRQGDEHEVLRESGRRQEGRAVTESSPASSYWDAYEIIYGIDGRARRIEPGLTPLAHGVPARVGKLRAYGNAIVPPLAARFVKAYLDTVKDRP